jgi:superfamily II DNA helicase RecQ
MKKRVGRRKRLPHLDETHCAPTWGRRFRFRLPTLRARTMGLRPTEGDED